MRKCERCGAKIWPWQDFFDYVFGDKRMCLCGSCLCVLDNYASKIMNGQRNYFLNTILEYGLCAKGLARSECEDLKDGSQTKTDACTRCWCAAAKEAARVDS